MLLWSRDRQIQMAYCIRKAKEVRPCTMSVVFQRIHKKHYTFSQPLHAQIKEHRGLTFSIIVFIAR